MQVPSFGDPAAVEFLFTWHVRPCYSHKSYAYSCGLGVALCADKYLFYLFLVKSCNAVTGVFNFVVVHIILKMCSRPTRAITTKVFSTNILSTDFFRIINWLLAKFRSTNCTQTDCTLYMLSFHVTYLNCF